VAFGNLAGRAGFELTLDKSQLDRGLAQAERDFNRATSGMAASATRAEQAIGDARVGGAGLAGRFAGMGSLLGRAGLVGIGLSTGISALNELQSALQVTGTEAYTAEGRLRNAAAAGGDLVAMVKALAAQPRTLADVGLDARGAAAGLSDLRRAADAFGGPFKSIYEEAKLAARGVAELDAASKNLLQTTLGLRDAQGRLVVGTLPGQQLDD
jgi:hypothetical protein